MTTHVNFFVRSGEKPSARLLHLGDGTCALSLTNKQNDDLTLFIKDPSWNDRLARIAQIINEADMPNEAAHQKILDDIDALYHAHQTSST